LDLRHHQELGGPSVGQLLISVQKMIIFAGY